MKGFLYFLGGLCTFIVISMFSRALAGLEEFSTVYVTCIVLMGALAYFLFKNAYLYNDKQDVIPIALQQKGKSIETKAEIDKATSKEEFDYLIDNGFDKSVLQQDSIRLWLDVIDDPDASAADKEMISTFFIPYRISMIKYGLNKEFHVLPDFLKANFQENSNLLGANGYSYIAPSLKVISKNPDLKLKVYPEFVYLAFPDVLYWALEIEILKVNELLNFYSDSELIEDGHISYSVLKKVIDLYIKSTKKPLECRIVDHYKL